MKKIAKLLAILVGILVVGFIALVLALPFLIDPNDYKPRIVELVKDHTGRDLSIDGEIKLSFFPWLGVELNRLTLSNATGFGPEPFAQIETGILRAKLIPLLRREVVVDKIRFSGLNLNLASDAKGRTNWEDMAEALQKPPAQEPAEEPSGGPGIGAFSVDGVEVDNARLTYRDAASGATYLLQDIALSSGRLELGRPTPIELSFALEASDPPIRSRGELATTALLDLAQQQLALSPFLLEFAGMRMKADIRGEQIVDKPRFHGEIDIAPFDAKALLAALGTPLETADPKALTRTSLQSRFDATANTVQLDKFSASVDQTKIDGKFALTDFANPRYEFDLKFDQLDLDRYLPPAAPAAAQDKPKAKPAASPANKGAAAADALAPLRTLYADGALAIQKLKSFGVQSSDVSAKLAAKQGVIDLNPIKAQLYGGSYAGSLRYDVRGKQPQLVFAGDLRRLQLEPFLRDADLYQEFAGLATMNIKVTAQGLDAADMVRTLSGTAGVEIENGALKGVDLAKMRTDIEAAIEKRNVGMLTAIAPRAEDTTRFSALQASTIIKDGVVSSDNLDIKVSEAGLRVGGAGTINLVEERMDYLIRINKIPVKVSGKFDALRFKPDWNAILKQQTDQQLQEKKEELREEQKELEDELKQKLDEKLKGLLKR